MTDPSLLPTHLRVKVLGVETRDGINTVYDRHDQTACGTTTLGVETAEAPHLVTCGDCLYIMGVTGYGRGEGRS